MRTYLFDLSFFYDLYDKIYIFFDTLDLSREILILKLISYLVSFFFIFLIIALLKRADFGWQLRERVYARESVHGAEKIISRWDKIKNRLEKGDQASLKLAVIEADKIIDDIFIRMALPGKDMQERLAQFQKHELSSVDLVWEAHRLRNLIVNNPKAEISAEQATEAIRYYETALKELEYLS